MSQPHTESDVLHSQPLGAREDGFSGRPEWHPEVVPLPFSLGPYALWRARLRLQVTRQALAGPLQTPEDLLPVLGSPPGGALPADRAGYLLFGHRLGGALPQSFRVGGWLAHVVDDGPQYVTDLTLGSEGYWAQFRGKTRNTLIRKVKAFKEASGGTLDWRLLGTPEEMRLFHTQAQALSQRTYQHQLLGHGLPSDEAFVARSMDKASRGDAWGCLLYFQGEPCAFFYMEGEGDVVGWDHVGYDSRLARLSPGTVLMTVVMEAFQAMGRYRFMDFGSGDSQHKALFATSRIRMGNVLLLRPTARHRVLLAVHWLFATVMGRALAALKRSGVHAWLKKTLKRRVAAEAGNIRGPNSPPDHDT